MDAAMKAWIDEASYADLLAHWQYAPTGDPLCIGEVGMYYRAVMARKRQEVGEGGHISALKAIKGRMTHKLFTSGTDGDARVISRLDQSGKRRTIAHVYGPDQDTLTPLFCAAPDLLDTVVALLARIRGLEDEGENEMIIRQAEVVLDKAGGREP